ncbi:unnamed protein product [Calypogeia fissa]
MRQDDPTRGAGWMDGWLAMEYNRATPFGGQRDATPHHTQDYTISLGRILGSLDCLLEVSLERIGRERVAEVVAEGVPWRQTDGSI